LGYLLIAGVVRVEFITLELRISQDAIKDVREKRGVPLSGDPLVVPTGGIAE